MDTNQSKNGTYHTLFHWQSIKFKLVYESIVVGMVTGLIIVAYRLLLDQASQLLAKIIEWEKQDVRNMIIWFIALMIIAYVVDYMTRKVPLIKGSGIPQVEGYLARSVSMDWRTILPSKFVGGLLAIGSGLSLGREGPSIQLGAAVGKGFSEVFKRKKVEEKFLITGGASAGLAAAFNAPLAGVMFSLEELHKNFSPIVLISALAASVSADFISKTFVGLEPVFDFSGLEMLPLKLYPFIIILGIILGFFGVFYNKSLLYTQKYYKRKTMIPKKFKKFIPFILAGIFGLVIPEVLGGGHHLIKELVELNFSMKMLIIIICVKFIFTMFSYGSGAPGGIFLPLLVLGALTGSIYGSALHSVFGIDQMYIQNMIVLAMAGYFTAIVRAPITGCILISEMAGSFQHLLALTVVSVVAYMVTDLVKSEPIYESLLERLVRSKRLGFKGDSDTKVIVEHPVCLGASVEGKMIRDISWPAHCLIVGVKRGHKEIIPTGETILQTGDYIIVMTDEDLAHDVCEQLVIISETCVVD